MRSEPLSLRNLPSRRAYRTEMFRVGGQPLPALLVTHPGSQVLARGSRSPKLKSDAVTTPHPPSQKVRRKVGEGRERSRERKGMKGKGKLVRGNGQRVGGSMA